MTTNAARRQKQHKIIAEQAALIVELRAEIQRLRAKIAAPSAGETVLVPREPTRAMGDAAQDVPCGIGGHPPYWKHIWAAMLAAAPTTGEGLADATNA